MNFEEIFIIVFSKNKIFAERVDAIVDSVEDVAEVVEQVAEKVEDIADEIGDKLPEGKLKGAFNFIEEIAKETAKDAHLVDEFIEKVCF